MEAQEIPREYNRELDQFEYSWLLTPESRAAAAETFALDQIKKMREVYGKKYFLSLDVESLGMDRVLNPTNSIGMFFGTSDGSEPDLRLKQKWNLLPFPGQIGNFETLSWWSTYADTLRGLQQNRLDPVKGANELHALFMAIVVLTGPKNTTLLSDCQDFDFGRIDDLMQRAQVTNLPVRFMGHGAQHMRHWSADPYAQSELLGRHYYPAFLKWLESKGVSVAHTHSPDDDAEMTYYQMIHVNLIKAKIDALSKEQLAMMLEV